MVNILIEISTIRKKVCIQYMYIMILILSFFTFYYFHENIKPLFYFVGFFLVTHIIFLFIPYKLSYESIKSLIPIYLIYASIFLYFEVLFFWSFKQIAIFLWGSVIPIGAMLFFSRGKVIFYSALVFIFMCSAFVIMPLIPQKYYPQLPTESQSIFISIATLIMSASLFLFFIYYQNKINQIRELQLNRYEEKEEKDVKDLSNTKFDKLYTDILNYCSQKKPYCDPDFTIEQLAKDIKSNVKYVSKVIRIKENVNFNIFMNRYRINQVKKMIDMNYLGKYTLSHIYATAGFRHQSTFNKAFKDIEGSTPTEYIKAKKATGDLSKTIVL